MIEPRELAHSDDALQAALVRALEENAMLRRALEERALAPSARRWVGRAIAAVILAAGLLAGALYAMRSDNARELRAGVQEGYMHGLRDGRATRAAGLPPLPPLAPAAPAPPPAPAPVPAPR
jgi:hypothetical protein